MKGLTADENFNVLRQYDEDIIDDDEDTDESDEEKQIKNTVSKFNLSKKSKSESEPNFSRNNIFRKKHVINKFP